MSDKPLSSLKVVELREELSKRNLPTKGKKDELISRLTEALEAEKNQVADKPIEETTQKPTDETGDKTIEKITEAPVEEKTAKTPEKSVTTQPVEEPKPEVTEEPESSNAEETGPMITEQAKPDSEEQTKQKEEQETKEPISGDQAIPNEIDMETDSNSNKRKRASDAEENANDEEKRIKVDRVEASNATAVYAKGFIRPLIIRHVQELFSKYGTIKRFWMDMIKTHCYVIYENEEEAKAANDNINGIVFPADTGKKLTVDYLTYVQAEKLIEHEQSAAEKRVKVDWESCITKIKAGEDVISSTTTESGKKSRSIGIGQVARQLAQAAEPTVTQSTREIQIERKEKPRDLSLDELFRKTKALPHLYYLPNSDQEAKIKLEKLQQI
ncbi:uncharacterized protein B0P05DRAFT_556695 [Gilbertella persicaria]|uniref:SAP domain-containing protein n=1 Tax=Rhizopus stolonifer TaxID=4846 RepID=A0A367KMJ4_RHIST|nr:uncharacterized protein B0P05DRAFT_556695 [Gilbertella persicaria]KAI8062373.1 hypothetical protein B0P05DRAFT_556695 [Gilbertella persicaria]RCI03455.1 hypothetical protein CU098_006948 [Rhizopus stolonifer]